MFRLSCGKEFAMHFSSTLFLFIYFFLTEYLKVQVLHINFFCLKENAMLLSEFQVLFLRMFKKVFTSLW